MLGEPVARWDAGGEFAATAQVLGERVLGGQSAWTGGGLAPVPCQYSFIAADLPFSGSPGCPAVLADQATENLVGAENSVTALDLQRRPRLARLALGVGRQVGGSSPIGSGSRLPNS